MADHGHSKDKSAEKKRSPHLVMPIVIGIGLLLAVGVIIIAVMSRSGAHEREKGDPVDRVIETSRGTRPVASTPQTQRMELVEHRAEPAFSISVPAFNKDWHVIDNRANWTLCALSERDGVAIEFRTTDGNWTGTLPDSGRVRGWRFRSETAESLELRLNWDTDPNCSTPVPS